MGWARALFLVVLLVGSGYAQERPFDKLQEVYPVETAFEDGGWTLLMRDMPWGTIINTLTPSTWMPKKLTDRDSVLVEIERGDDEVKIVVKRIRNGVGK